MKISEMLGKIADTIAPVKPTLYQQLIEVSARLAAKPSPFHMGTPARKRMKSDRSLGPTSHMQSIRNLFRANRKGFYYDPAQG